MKLVISDLSNIEGRMLAWLADEQWKLDAFRAYDRGDGPDVYNLTAVSILGGDPYKMSKENRNVFGKVPDLACGYQGGVGAFQTFSKAYGVRMADYADEIGRLPFVAKAVENWDSWGRARAEADEIERTEWLACETVKLAWRARHPATRQLWWDLETAARSAIENPGAVYRVGKHLRVGTTEHEGQQWLLVRMPSGRYLTYFAPRLLDTDGYRPAISYMGMGAEDGKPGSRRWSRLVTHGGKLVENCIAQDTPVLTARGWVPIQSVRGTDLVWDGEEWVAHGGLVYRGKEVVLSVFGVQTTPEHLILTTEGWRRAETCHGLHRCPVRIPNGHLSCRIFQEGEANLAATLRLRHRETAGVVGHSKGHTARNAILMRVQAPRSATSEAMYARDVSAPGVRSVAFHACAVLSRVASGIQELRRAWNSNLLVLAQIFRSVLGRHGANVSVWSDTGTPQQQSGVLSAELLLGHVAPASSEYPQDTSDTDPMGTHPDNRGGAQVGDRSHYDLVPAPSWVARDAIADPTRSPKQAVYDILNCGPRRRFAVLGTEGPVIVHNCVQALARDVFAHNMPAAEAAGYEIVLTEHDELVTQTPDTPDYNVETLSAIMSTVPPWAEGLPLAAAGFETYRYRKE